MSPYNDFGQNLNFLKLNPLRGLKPNEKQKFIFIGALR